MKKVTVLGDGAWGTAIAMVLADNGYDCTLWCHNPEVAHAITTQGRNTFYLPDCPLDTSRIHPTADLFQAISHAEFVFEAVPVMFLRSVLQQARNCIRSEQIWIILSKGIEQKTLLLPTQMIDDVFGIYVHKAVISGPSFAKDLANKQVTAVSLAAADGAIGVRVRDIMANDYFRPYLNVDIIGTQLCGALKNSIALAIGILDGAGYTDNVKTFFLIRGLHEMADIVAALGGKSETLYDLAGVGDLVLTALGKYSKNVACGRKLGAGQSLSDLQRVGVLPEGVNTTASIHQLLQQRAIQAPLFSAIHDVVFNNKSANHLIDMLIHNHAPRSSA